MKHGRTVAVGARRRKRLAVERARNLRREEARRARKLYPGVR